ncbi:universal stress protein [Ramlibacter sp. MMS24-I3-19]|uniref:universal stress protein n=1 Tax=Ramlibacter sp. MMS24-I3-19 TaxID=3416606 RepID=UPI003D066076
MTTDWRNIIIHLEGAEGAANRLLVARKVALAHEARLSALHAALPAGLLVPQVGAGMGEIALAMGQLDIERRDGSRGAFDVVLRQAGMDASWAELTEVSADENFIRCAMLADLVVLGQPQPDLASRGMPVSFVPHVLARCGRPCLVVPHSMRIDDGPVKTVVVAWKETPESVRAVVGALPLLRQATRVHVLTWGGKDLPARGPLPDMPAWLRTQGVQASVAHEAGEEPRDLGELLLSRCADLGADVLVMGCYGHSRAREWLLGGVTRTLLSSMTLPVLMAH